MRGCETIANVRPRVGPGLLATSMATVLVVTLLVVLLWIVTVNALRWFWPAPVWRLELVDGHEVVGEVVDRQQLPARAEAPADHRLLVKTGNRETAGQDHRWVRESRIVGFEKPPSVVRITRTRFGNAYGWIRQVRDFDGTISRSLDPKAIKPVLDEANQLRDRAAELRRASDRLRRPVTRLEHEAATLRRSSHAQSPSGLREAEALRREIEHRSERIAPRLEPLASELATIDERLRRASLVITSGGVERSIPLADVLEVQWPNSMSALRRVTIAVRDFGCFLVDPPREANTEGGIFPALFGTVLMVLLMSLAVMPLGVLTAVYMNEYARDGIALKIAQHAINNLAGVPSIVIGIFGLSFFVYGIGGGIDRVFFAADLPTPTFGTGGILWASLTLALLTVPVVVVATREGLLAVPKERREGAMALGATKWQTLRRIVLPAATPGILTGLILAIGRAVGEVAPLMLTGVVKLAPNLPVDGSPPFVHLERKFMHLGYFIFDVSMQSPNVEAAKPMVFAATLVLLGLVLVINLTAIVVRRRLRLVYRVMEI